MKIPLLISSATVLLTCSLVGCSKSPDPKATQSASSEPTADTSYLDELAAKQGIEIDQSDEGSADHEPELDDAEASDAGEPEGDEEREWEKERESQSLFGRSRDKASDLRDKIQGGTSPSDGLAYTLSEEEYASSSGLRWEMPEGWSMAVPPRGQFAEMYIKNALGNASVSFTKETGSVRDIVRIMQGQFVDSMGGRTRAKTEDKTIAGYPVQIVDLDGTYIDPGAKGGSNEQIFYAMHAAIFDLGESRIVIKMWGPQDTVNLSTRAFDSMIDETTQK
tara:strand:+ start:81899 stop:82732 length:834 start_codon:yes stop_codon:yes gene_type:complete